MLVGRLTCFPLDHRSKTHCFEKRSFRVSGRGGVRVKPGERATILVFSQPPLGHFPDSRSRT